MAHVEERRKGGKRQTNIDLNLVPFIDLMSVLITFLLITAVWTQVSMIQIGSSVYGQVTDDKKPEQNKDQIAFRLDIKPFGYRVVIAKQTYTIQKSGGDFDDESLINYLKDIKKTYPDKEDCIITIDDELPYKALIQGMDALLTAGFPQLAVATGGVE